MQINLLFDARQLADYAKSFGPKVILPRGPQPTYEHVGATLADSILQAGVNYASVVFPRVSRILQKYPSTDTMEGTKRIVQQGSVEEYLAWRHPTKLRRFSDLVELLEAAGVTDMDSLREWLQIEKNKKELVQIKGIGLKTCDYLCRLAGLDHVAVDRHITHFVRQAGVKPNGYEHVKAVVSFAADLLGFSRREFDSWIWALMANGSGHESN